MSNVWLGLKSPHNTVFFSMAFQSCPDQHVFLSLARITCFPKQKKMRKQQGEYPWKFFEQQ